MSSSTALVLQVAQDGSPRASPDFVRAMWARTVIRRSVATFCTREPTEVHLAVAADALVETARIGPSGVVDERAITLLADELGCSMRELGPKLGLGPQSIAAGGALGSIRDGMLWLDAIGADHLEGVGPTGRDQAQAMRESSRRRIDRLLSRQLALDPGGGIVADPLDVPAGVMVTPANFLWWNWRNPTYAPTPVRFARVLACCLWVDRVQPAIAATKYPTLSLEFASAASRAFFTPGRTVEQSDRGVVIVAPSGAQVGAVNRAVAVAAVPRLLLRDGPGLTANLMAQRVFRDIPFRTREHMIRERLNSEKALPRVCIDGGLSAYCGLLGVDEGRTKDLREVLDVFQGVHAIGEDGREYHGLLLWEEERATRHRNARVWITPSRAILTGSRGKLIPIPRRLPHFAGSPNERAAQAALQLLVIMELRARAVELLERGGVRITPGRWTQLAAEPGVSRVRLEELLREGWVVDVGDEPAFLCRLERDMWTLGPAYHEELGVLLDGAAYDAAGRRGGRAAAERRARIAGLISNREEKS